MEIRTVPAGARARLSAERSRRRRIRGAAAVLAAAALACGVLGLHADRAPAAASPRGAGTALRTPLGSPRRTPGVFVDAIAGARLSGAIAAVVAPYDACAAVDTGPPPGVRIAAARPLAGASTQKLLVGAAALATLGPGYRFVTRAVSDVAPAVGRLDGDLVVVGSGDPLLVSSPAPGPNVTHLTDLADAIARRGIREITGALVADDSVFDRERAVADWKPSELAEGDVGALGALVVDGGRDESGRAAADPGLVTVDKLATMLRARGVRVDGGVRSGAGAASAGATEVARVESPRLDAIVTEMLTVSDDETAELLTKALGRAPGRPGTTAAGTRAVVDTVARLGVPVAGVDLRDGSGLAPTDRVTCGALLRAVELGDRPRFAALDAGLPVAGRTGTLASRFAGTPLAGRLRAKTGHIDGVVGLAGVLDPAPGRPAADRARFAFVADGAFSTARGELLQDEVAGAIATYPDTTAATAIVPGP